MRVKAIREPLLPASLYAGEHHPSLSPLRDLSPFPRRDGLCRSAADKIPGSSLAKTPHTHDITVPRVLGSSWCHGPARSRTPSSTEQRLGSTRSFPKQNVHCMQAGGRRIVECPGSLKRERPEATSTDPWRVLSPHTSSKSSDNHRFNRAVSSVFNWGSRLRGGITLRFSTHKILCTID